jgi:PAS domain S-box-containing protein
VRTRQPDRRRGGIRGRKTRPAARRRAAARPLPPQADAPSPYRQIVEAAAIGVLHADGEGRCVYTNAAWQRLTGLQAEQGLGDGWAQAVLPAEREDVHRAWQQSAREGRPFHREFRLRGPAGYERRVRVHAVPIAGEDGGPLGRVATFEDVTDVFRIEAVLRDSEERFRHLVDRAGDVIFRTDATGKYTFLGATVTAVLGYTVEEMQGWSYLDVIVPEHHEDVQAFYLRQYLERIPVTYHEFPVITKDRRVLWIGQKTRLVQEPDGEFAWEAVARDITERKRLEQEREDLVAALQEALASVKTLRGLLPICASCKKIRDDKGYWNQIEVYVRDHSQADFSHGICPECLVRLYPEFANEPEQ